MTNFLNLRIQFPAITIFDTHNQPLLNRETEQIILIK